MTTKSLPGLIAWLAEQEQAYFNQSQECDDPKLRVELSIQARWYKVSCDQVNEYMNLE